MSLATFDLVRPILRTIVGKECIGTWDISTPVVSLLYWYGSESSVNLCLQATADKLVVRTNLTLMHSIKNKTAFLSGRRSFTGGGKERFRGNVRRYLLDKIVLIL